MEGNVQSDQPKLEMKRSTTDDLDREQSTGVHLVLDE